MNSTLSTHTCTQETPSSKPPNPPEVAHGTQALQEGCGTTRVPKPAMQGWRTTMAVMMVMTRKGEGTRGGWACPVRGRQKGRLSERGKVQLVSERVRREQREQHICCSSGGKVTEGSSATPPCLSLSYTRTHAHVRHALVEGASGSAGVAPEEHRRFCRTLESCLSKTGPRAVPSSSGSHSGTPLNPSRALFAHLQKSDPYLSEGGGPTATKQTSPDSDPLIRSHELPPPTPL